MKPQDRYRWRNWLGNQQCVAAHYRPRTVDDLEFAVRQVAEGPSPARKGIRPVGGSYAWSPLIPTRGTLIRPKLTTRNGVLRGDPESCVIEVEAAATLRQLVDGARELGLTVRGVPIFVEMSVGGALAVGAHGTGQRWGTMSDHLLELKLVLPDGRLQVFAHDHPLFPALAVSLGTMGVIYSATFQCEKAFQVRVERGFLPKSMIDQLADVLATYEFVEIYWFLTHETVWAELMNRTTAPARRAGWPRRAFRWLRDKATWLFGGLLLPFLAWLSPSLVRRIMSAVVDLFSPTERDRRPRWFARLVLKYILRQKDRSTASKWAFGWVSHFTSEVLVAEDAFHYIHSVIKSWDSEFSIRCDPDEIRALWGSVQEAVARAEKQGRYPVNLCMHARFVDESRPLLSPAHGRKSCFIELATLKGTPDAEAFFEEFHDLAMRSNPSARPHWGKFFDPWESDEIRARYPGFETFVQMRNTIDPEGRFINRVLERFLK